MVSTKRRPWVWVLGGALALLVGVAAWANASTDTPSEDEANVASHGPVLDATNDVADVTLQSDAASAQSSSWQQLAPSVAAGERLLEARSTPAYINTFSEASDFHRIDHFVHYRDPFVVNHRTGTSDHASTGGPNCSAPEETRPQTRDAVEDHIYLCFPGGDAAKGHVMAYAMDSSGYGFTGGLPDQVFEGVREVSVEINATNAGARNFVEIKVLPADQTFVNAMPCGPDLPCNDGWDYDDIGGVGASTDSQEGTGLTINTPQEPDGYHFELFDEFTNAEGTNYRPCHPTGDFCFHAWTHEDTLSIRDRYLHVFRDNGDGTLSFGIAQGAGGTDMHWVTAPGSFPEGPVRVVLAFHNYTGTKDGDGPGSSGNVSPSTGGFTWHWDNLIVLADKSTPSQTFFGGNSADRIVTPNNCVAFSQGQRGTDHGSDIAPEFRCK